MTRDHATLSFRRTVWRTALLIFTLIAAAPVFSPHVDGQERFSFFQASTPESVERMLTLAGLRDDDVVFDLGSGNGLIPLTSTRPWSPSRTDARARPA
jgi:hypothetical protein